AEGLTLGRAMHALAPVVEDEQHPPARRKFQARHDRRHPVAVVATAVHHEPALLENADADARPGAAIEQRRIVARVERVAVESPQGCRDSERQLRARSEPRMGRYGVVDDEIMAIGNSEMAAHSGQVAGHPLGLAALDAALAGWTDGQAGDR